MDMNKSTKNSEDTQSNNDEKESNKCLEQKDENLEVVKGSDTTTVEEEKGRKYEKNEFGIRLYDNDLKYSDDIQTIIKKVINEKNIHFFKKYSSFLLYLSNEAEYIDIDDRRKQKKEANDENTKVFFKIQLAPQNISIIYNILDRSMIEKILTLCANKYKKSKTSIGYATDKQENYKITNSSNRTSSTVFLYTIRNRSVIEKNHVDSESSIVYTKDESIMDLENTICNLVKIPLCYLEPLAIVKYEKNNYFNIHHDGTFRRATLLIYLNDVEKDGETIFPHYNLSIKPIQGSGIFWYNNIPVEEEHAITYCVNRINEIHEKDKLKYVKNVENNTNSSTAVTSSTLPEQGNQDNTLSSSKNAYTITATNFNNTTEDEFSNVYKTPITKTIDLINFLKEKSNLEKFSIDVINDELGNMYIADMTMLHKANKVSDEYKYVINCFFNINIVRNV
ncbi:prolyl 4-hydroxylase subunit alpha [Plasmodium gonderi]|uniref:Prolyl 4-hydroxylase subunit alpha n=1 Tax=Plasmodium gonderi TaxID=77519 RepID=A0A1Y1JFU0_PLAGO|nr:prolyl 4-hydroxylase subunit alpha [Plasmodium gonderi]GAW79612.1 prolyl 4-hydroxylase subunit alpha [Plasmodium gonderi]